MGADMQNREGASLTRLLLARVLCAVAIGLVLFGAYFISVATEVVALLLGATGYLLGARRLGLVTVGLAVIAAFVGLWWGAGRIPMFGT